MNRRDIFAASAAALTSAVLAPAAQATPRRRAATRDDFLWGAAISGHQTEGNLVGDDIWVLENIPDTLFKERSGDACDHFNRYEEDIAIVADLGLNCLRFSIEWSRVEPERGFFSQAALAHYRRVLTSCHARGVAPMVSLNHFANPRWFAAAGGWEAPDAGDLFVRYCETVVAALGDLITVASTFNEPQLAQMIFWGRDMSGMKAAQDRMLTQAAKSVGSDRFQYYLSGDLERVQTAMIAAHHRAFAAIKAGPGDFPVGVTLAMSDDQAVGPDSRRDEKRNFAYRAWLDAAAQSDFVGVQVYTRTRIDGGGPMRPPEGAELTSTNWEFYPQALENTLQYVASACPKPIYVTENGVATADDTRRVAYVREAVAGLRRAKASGVDVRGYVHWALLDNYEWSSGYGPQFGLVGVDSGTFARTLKPSARVLGEEAALPI